MQYFGENMHKPCFFCIKGEKYTFLVWDLDKTRILYLHIYHSLFALIILAYIFLSFVSFICCVKFSEYCLFTKFRN